MEAFFVVFDSSSIRMKWGSSLRCISSACMTSWLNRRLRVFRIQIALIRYQHKIIHIYETNDGNDEYENVCAQVDENRWCFSRLRQRCISGKMLNSTGRKCEFKRWLNGRWINDRFAGIGIWPEKNCGASSFEKKKRKKNYHFSKCSNNITTRSHMMTSKNENSQCIIW